MIPLHPALCQQTEARLLAGLSFALFLFARRYGLINLPRQKQGSLKQTTAICFRAGAPEFGREHPYAHAVKRVHAGNVFRMPIAEKQISIHVGPRFLEVGSQYMSFAGLEIGIHIASVKQMGILEIPDIRVNTKGRAMLHSPHRPLLLKRYP